jgi:hypothetical protein
MPDPRIACRRAARVLAGLPIIAVLLLLPTAAQAWGNLGHKIVAQIAFKDLRPETKKNVVAILRAHPRFKDDLLLHMPANFPDPGLYAFIQAATWPDMVRDPKNPFHEQELVKKQDRHFIDFPFVPEEDKDNPAVKPVLPKDDNILVGLRSAIDDLTAIKAPDERQGIQLCWLIHLVGDIHQPLHTASRFSKSFPHGDRGGNSCIVTTAAGVNNLHTLWDDIFGLVHTPKVVSFHVGVITAAFPRETLKKDLQINDFDDWAKDSFSDAVHFAYLGGELEGKVRPANFDERKANPQDFPPLPDSYLDTTRNVARRRLALAGYRLADRLNALLK